MTMGYTHYFDIKEKLSDEEMVDLVGIFEKIYSVDNGKTIFKENEWNSFFHYQEGNTEKVIAFNGDHSNDLDHETFYLSQNETGFNFCKTGFKPYDTAVVAMLIALKMVAGDKVRISSDGDLEDCKKGNVLFNKVSVVPVSIKFDDKGSLQLV